MTDDALAPDEVEVVERARTWADEAVAPQAEEWETERRFGSEAFASAATTGVMAPVVDGGRGLEPVVIIHCPGTWPALV